MNGLGKFSHHNHSWDCVCGGCSAFFVSHNRDHTCDCGSCEIHRTHALTKNPKARAATLNAIAENNRELSTMRGIPRIGERKQTVATVNFCEKHKCEAMGKNTAMGLVVIIPATSGPESVYADAVHTTDRNTVRKELCPGCIGELMEWIDAEPMGERKKYTEPWSPAPKVSQTDVERVLRDMGSQDLMRLAIEASNKEAGLSE